MALFEQHLSSDTQPETREGRRAGTGGLRFDQCVIRHGQSVQWWRVDQSGWLYSRYVESA